MRVHVRCACEGRYPLRSYSCVLHAHSASVPLRSAEETDPLTRVWPWNTLWSEVEKRGSGGGEKIVTGNMAAAPKRQDTRKFFENLSGAGKSIAVLTSGGDAQGNAPRRPRPIIGQ